MTVLLHAEHVSRVYTSAGKLFQPETEVRALDDVSITLEQGETLGVVGESGSGKSTLGQVLLGLAPVSNGHVTFMGRPLPAKNTQAWRRLRAQMQLIFQDPLAALDPRLSIGDQIGEPLDIHGLGTAEQRRAAIEDLALSVGLNKQHLKRFPQELSGGQRQRAVIARAMASKPQLLVCDEPVSALDVSIQAQVVNTFRRLQRQSGVTMVFISHDLKVVRNIAQRVAVMYLGKIVEEGPSDVIFKAPRHPYTKALVSSIPKPGKPLNERVILQGEPPNPAHRPSGCAFHPRCALATDECARSLPVLKSLETGRRVACHLVQTMPFGTQSEAN